MEMFSLALPRHVLFGRGAADQAVAACLSHGTRVLMLRSASAPGAGQLARRLEAEGADLTLQDHRGEPELPALEARLSELAEAPPEVILAVGGGSVIDMGKALAALLPQPEGPRAYLEVVGDGRALDRDPLPLIALPTTAGTGSEATRNAVIGVPEAGRKVSLRDSRMLPRCAIVDPALTDGSPEGVTLSSGLDAVAQVIEPYLSCRATPVTDALCRDAIPRGIEALYWLMNEDHPKARDEMAYVSLIGGVALANAGLGAMHGLAGVAGGRTGQAHGVIVGRLMGPVLRANAEALTEAQAPTGRIDYVLRVLADQFGVPKVGALDALQDWIDDCGLPPFEAPSAEAELEDWAAASESASSMRGNPVPLDRETLVGVLARASA
ncbi:iron-containing alcohol dehydrogenase [Roseivivax sp.]